VQYEYLGKLGQTLSDLAQRLNASQIVKIAGPYRRGKRPIRQRHHQQQIIANPPDVEQPHHMLGRRGGENLINLDLALTTSPLALGIPTQPDPLDRHRLTAGPIPRKTCPNPVLSPI
jgi:hypothetical protein